MSPKKKRYFPRRPQRRSPATGGGEDPAVDIEAKRLVETFPLSRLEEMVDEAEEAYQRADQESQINPGAQALGAYRSAARALAAAQRAVVLASAEPVGTG